MSHLQNIFFWEVGGGGGGEWRQVGEMFERGGGSQGGCEQRIDVFVKFKKKLFIFFFWGGGGGGGLGRVGGAGGRLGGGGGVRVDVNEELKFL